jgi:carbamate kinase
MDDRIEGLPERLMVAIGGNALHPGNAGPGGQNEAARADHAAQALLPLLLGCRQLVITHGNGPVVGEILLRQFHAREFVPSMPLDVCVAASQGVIGYLIAQSLPLRRRASPSVRSLPWIRHAPCRWTVGR